MIKYFFPIPFPNRNVRDDIIFCLANDIFADRKIVNHCPICLL